jgi:hypothetical protein
MKALTAFLILIMAPTLFAQTPQVEWWVAVGDSNSDKAVGIYQTPDGGYMVGGHARSFGGCFQDCFFIRLNGDGDTLWTRTHGSPTGSENINGFSRTPGGGYIAVGSYQHPSYSPQFYLFEIGYGHPDYAETGYGVVALEEGGYVFTGSATRTVGGTQAAVVKIDTAGVIEWDVYYGLQELDVGYSVIATDDSCYIIAGSSSAFVSPGNKDLLLMKVDANGDTLWLKNYGGEQDDRAYKVIQTSDGGMIAVGYSISYGGGYYKDWYIVRADSMGDTLWTRAYGNPYEDVAMDVKELPNNGGFVVAGSMHDGQWDACVLRLDVNGDSLWGFTVGGTGYEIAYGIELTDDGGYIICGQTDSYGQGNYDVYIVKLSPDISGIEDGAHRALPDNIYMGRNYPNPFNASTTISYSLPEPVDIRIEIFDILGRRVERLFSGPQQEGAHTVTWRPGDISSGVYYYRVGTEDFNQRRSCLLIK